MMSKLLEEIKQFNNGKTTPNIVDDYNHYELFNELEEIEYMYKNTNNYEQVLFDRYGYDYLKDERVLYVSKQLEECLDWRVKNE